MNNNKAHNYEARTWMRRRCEQVFAVRTPGLKARKQLGSPIDLWDTLPPADRLDLLAAAQARPGYKALLNEAANKAVYKVVGRGKVYKSQMMAPLLDSGEYVTIEEAMKMTGFKRHFFHAPEFASSRILARAEYSTKSRVLILRATVEKVAAESFPALRATGKYVMAKEAAEIFGVTDQTAIKYLGGCPKIHARTSGSGGPRYIWLYDRAEVEQAAADYRSKKPKKSPTP